MTDPQDPSPDGRDCLDLRSRASRWSQGAWGWLKVRSEHFPAKWEWLNRSSGALLVILTLAYCMGSCLQWRAISEANRNANTALVAQRGHHQGHESSFDPTTALFGEAVLLNTGQTVARDM